MHQMCRPSSVVLKMFDTFQSLSEMELQSLSEFSKFVDAKPGQVIVAQGCQSDFVFFILTGVAKLTRNVNSAAVDDSSLTEVVVQLFVPGDAIGDAGVFQNVIFKATVRAVTPCQLLAVEKSKIQALAKSNMAVLASLYNRASKKFFKSVECADYAYGRVIKRIEKLAFEFKKIGLDLYKHLSKAEIARMLGASRVAVSNCLSLHNRSDNKH